MDAGLLGAGPIDPVNAPNDYNGHPSGKGIFYVYLKVPQGYGYDGGSCVVDSGSVWVFGISELETNSQISPGCDCLWKNIPDFFQGSLDYVACGTY